MSVGSHASSYFGKFTERFSGLFTGGGRTANRDLRLDSALPGPLPSPAVNTSVPQGREHHDVRERDEAPVPVDQSVVGSTVHEAP